jgi:hypothetical protein
VNSFVSVFPFVVELRFVGELGDVILLGSDRPMHFDARLIAFRLREPTLNAYLEAAGWDVDAIGHLLSSSRVKTWEPDDPRPHDDINTDLFPKDEFYLSGYN